MSVSPGRIWRGASRWWLGANTLSHSNATRAVLACAAATGFTGLAYETVWHRYLTAILGSNTKAAALLTGLFLASMSLGCAFAGRLTRRRPTDSVRLYGWAEIVLGCWALAFPWLIRIGTNITDPFSGGGLLIDTLLTLALIAPPAALMGASIPVLTHLLDQNRQETFQKHAWLYAINTLGAFAGVVVTGFFLIDMLGLAGTLITLAPINLVVGVIFLDWKKIVPSWKGNATLPAKSQLLGKPISMPGLLAAITLSSYSFLALENWTFRLAGIATEGSAIIFAIVIAAFVLATGLGALAVGFFKKVHPRILPWALILSTAAWIAVYGTADLWPYSAYWLEALARSQGSGPMELQIYRLGALSALLLVPVALAGTYLPLCFGVIRQNDQHSGGSAAGAVYSASALGLAVGAIFGGYTIFLWTGLSGTFKFSLMLQLLATAVSLVALRTNLTQRQILTCAGALLFLLLGAIRMPNLNPERLALSYYYRIPPESGVPPEHQARKNLYQYYGLSRVVSFATGPEATVAVIANAAGSAEHVQSLTINGRRNGTTTKSEVPGNAILGLLPYLLANEARDTLVIGYGTGATAGALAQLSDVKKVTVLERSREVIARAKDFDFASYQASQNPKIQILEKDAVRYLRSGGPRFDIITSVPSNLWVSGMEDLLTVDYFKAARRSIKPGGVFLQWIPDYSFSTQALATTARAFTEAFPGATLWRLGDSDLALVYADNRDSQKVFERISLRSSQISFQKTLASIGIKDPLLPLLFQIASSDMLESLAHWGSPHTINHPSLGRSAMTALLWRKQSSDTTAFIQETVVFTTGSLNGFFSRQFSDHAEPFSDSRVHTLTDEMCEWMAPTSIPCRYLVLASPNNSRTPFFSNLHKQLVPHFRHAAITGALKEVDPNRRARRLSDLQVRDEEIVGIASKYQNPIRPLHVPQLPGDAQ